MLIQADDRLGRRDLPCSSPSGGTIGSVLIFALSVSLAGCGGGETVGEALGYEQTGPDEMTVIKRPPLTVPPDYNLRPPRPSDPSSDADSASKAARETLVGPSSELASEVPAAPADQTEASGPSSAELTSAQERAKATLIGEQRYQKSPPLIDDDGQIAAATTESAPSAGQTALLSRTNRVERDLDALDETRSENRVDGVLLRRLLAWQPPAANQKTTGADSASVSKSGDIVKIVRREQNPVSAGSDSK